MSNSKRKMDVIVKRMEKWGGKRWAVVKLKQGDEFYPSFEDLWRMIQAISYCEDEKYPPEKGYKGRRFVAEFLTDAVYERDWAKLAAKYKIPIRCGTDVVNDNGANLGGAAEIGNG